MESLEDLEIQQLIENINPDLDSNIIDEEIQKLNIEEINPQNEIIESESVEEINPQNEIIESESVEDSNSKNESHVEENKSLKTQEEFNLDNIEAEQLADDFIKIKDRQELKKKQSEILIKMIKAINFDVNSIDDIAKLTLDRDFLKDTSIQKKIIEFIPELRTCYNSAYLTCLHQNAVDKQKNLGINILRQILKCNYLKMTPKVVSHGYDKTTGKKLVSRIYLIQKLLY